MISPLFTLRSALAAATMFLVASAASAQTPDLSEDKLIEVLTSDASKVDKSNACRMLRIKGTEKSVPALAKLLTDEDLSHAARVALEPMPYESAGEALRTALEETDGLIRVGLVTSLGNRQDEEAISLLAPLLDSDDSVTRDAAILAVGKIATLEAAEVLIAARDEANENGLPKIDRALLLVAHSRSIRGKQPVRPTIYDHLALAHMSDWGERTPGAATRSAVAAGMLKSAIDNRPKLCVSMLTADDPVYRRGAASQLTALAAEELKLVAEKFTELPADSQIALLAAIRLRRVKDLAPAVIEAAKSDNHEVQLAALRALGQIGDRTALPFLIEHTFGDGPTATAAREALTRLYAPGVDEELATQLTAEQDPARRAKWIALVAARNSTGLVDLLLSEATHAAPEVRQPAMAALTKCASPQHLPAMTKAVLAAPQGAERDAAEKAVMLVAQQSADPARRGAEVLEVYRHATPADQQALLPLLGRIGGDEAKQTILAIVNAGDASEAQREAAIRALANWPDASVADELRSLAKESEVPRHRQWALRALIRVVSLPDAMPDHQKLAELKQAIELAERDDERRLALQRMGSVRTVESLRLLVPYLESDKLAQPAAQSITELARHGYLRNPHKEEFIAALEKVIAASTTDDRTRVQAQRHLQALQQ